ncbi:MAG: nucleotidyltransferase family protein [Candidatus Sumerlaeota bacterium]|nr:nucleotidyltransferase family protein [Candidatus Sumerlaeota bacterium]
MGDAEALSDLSAFTPEKWTRVADMATKSCLSPLLFRCLPITNPSLGIPKGIITRWFREHLISLSWNNKLYQHLEEALAVFNREGVPVMLLKGVHLMDNLYAERGMRSVGDIDILIQTGGDKKKAMERTTRLMRELGYTLVTSALIEDPIHTSYVHSKSDVMVEVHFELETDTPVQLNPSLLWEGSLPITIGNQSARSLAPEQLLVHLSFHLVHHLIAVFLFPPVLRSLYDIALLLRRQSDRINWERVEQILQNAKGEKSFYTAMALSEKMLGAAMPEHVKRAMSHLEDSRSLQFDALKKHIFFSCEREFMDTRIPKFMRSSIMANRTSPFSGFLNRVFVSREELARRYGRNARWYSTCWKYLLHFTMLLRNKSHFGALIFKSEANNLSAHYRNLAIVRERLGMQPYGAGRPSEHDTLE